MLGLQGSWFKGICAFPRPKMHPFGWRKSSAEICLIRFELKPESKSDRSASVQLFRPIPTLTSTPTPTPLKSLFSKTSNFRRNSSFCIGGRSLEAEIMTLGPSWRRSWCYDRHCVNSSADNWPPDNSSPAPGPWVSYRPNLTMLSLAMFSMP